MCHVDKNQHKKLIFDAIVMKKCISEKYCISNNRMFVILSKLSSLLINSGLNLMNSGQ